MRRRILSCLLLSRSAAVLCAVLAVLAASPRSAEATCPPGFVGANCDQCASGYYGPSCLPCPGGVSNPCNGNGVCSDGISGSGTCLCLPPFQPPACLFGLSGMTPTHGPGAGGTSLTISGGGLGSFGSVSIGGATAPIVSWSSTQIVCLTPPGYGQNRPVGVTLSGGAILGGLLFDYDLPTPPAAPAAGPLGRGAIVVLLLGAGAALLARSRRFSSRGRAA